MSSIRRTASNPPNVLDPSAARETQGTQATQPAAADAPAEGGGAEGANEGRGPVEEGVRLAARERAMQAAPRPAFDLPPPSAKDEIVEVFTGLAAPAPADADPVSARSAISPDAVKELLQQVGLDVGDGPGLDDETTRQSIRDFQEDMGLKATGELDLETLVALLEAAMNNDRRLQTERSNRGARLEGSAPGVAGSAGATSAQRSRGHVQPEPTRRTAPVDTASWKPGAGDVTPQQLQRIVPGLSDAKAREVAPHLNRAMAEANIHTPERKAAFVAQLAHESGGFQHMQETGSGARYEGRRELGNTQPGDGERFKGRGFIQITGRANYAAASRALGEDFVNHPERASTPENAARIAAWYWNSRGLNGLADRGDFRGITQRINGGQTGAADRAAFHARAVDVLKDSQGVPATGRFLEQRAQGTSAAAASLTGSDRGARLAQEARAVAQRMNTVGACAKGVGDALQRIGIQQRGNAYEHAEKLARRGDFREVSVGRDDLRKLPAGAIVVWGRSEAKPYGHVAVSLGNGLEASDHVQRMVTNGPYGTDFGKGPTGRPFRVFMPA